MIQCKLHKLAEPKSLQYGIAVEVCNGFDFPLERVHVNWYYEVLEDTGPPRDEWGNKRRKTWKIVEFGSAGDEPLQPGDSAAFYYDAAAMPELLSEINGLSSDDYELSIHSGSETLLTIPGRHFGAWVLQQFCEETE